MKEYYGNILDLIGKERAICITTNLFVKSNGCAVMGRGIAKAIKDMLPGIDSLLGKAINDGVSVGVVANMSNTDIIALPVKPAFEYQSEYVDVSVSHMVGKFKPGDKVPGWACKADMSIIIDSLKKLVHLANEKKYDKIYLPRPGCGAGELDYADVKPALSALLDDRFYVSTFKKED